MRAFFIENQGEFYKIMEGSILDSANGRKGKSILDQSRGSRSILGHRGQAKSARQIEAENAQAHVTRLLKEKEFKKAKAYAALKTNLPRQWREAISEQIRKQEEASIIEDLTINQAREYIKDNLENLTRKKLNPPFLIFNLDIQELLQEDNYDAAIKKLSEAIKAGKIDKKLDTYEKKKLLVLLAKVVAMQAQHESGKAEIAIAVINKLIQEKKIEGIDMTPVIKDLKEHREELYINYLASSAASKALDYLNNNQSKFDKGLQLSSLLGNDKCTELKLKMEIEAAEALSGVETAWEKAQTLRPKLIQAMGKLETLQLFETLKIRMIQQGKMSAGFGIGPEAAIQFLNLMKNAYTNPKGPYKFSVKEWQTILHKAEIGLRSQDLPTLTKYIEANKASLREHGINGDKILKQARIFDKLDLLPQSKALALIGQNGTFLKQQGVNLELLEIQYKIETLLQKGEKGSIEQAKKVISDPGISALFLKGLKENYPEHFTKVIKHINKGELTEAEAYLASLEGKVEQKILDTAFSYISFTRTIQDIRIGFVVKNLPSPINTFGSQESMEIGKVIYSTDKDSSLYIADIQRMLSATRDENGIYYLAGAEGIDWKAGELDTATAGAIYRFVNREARMFSTPAQREHETKKAALAQDEKKDLTLVWTNQNYKDLKAEFVKSASQAQSVSIPLGSTKIGLEIKKAALELNISGNFQKTGFILCLLKYLEGQKLDKLEKPRVERLEKWLTSGKEIVKEADLQWLYSKSTTVDIDSGKIKDLVAQYKNAKTIDPENLPNVWRVGTTLHLYSEENYDPLNIALSKSELGKAITDAYYIENSESPQKNFFIYMHFIYCALEYMISENPKNKEAYQRIQKALAGDAKITKEDLALLGKEIGKVKIDRSRVREIVNQWEKSPQYLNLNNSLPAVWTLADGSFRTIEAIKQTQAASTDLAVYPMHLFQTREKLAYWINNYVQSGGRLDSYRQGSSIIPPYLTAADLRVMAEHEEKMYFAPYIHYLPAPVADFLAGKASDAQLKPLLDRLLADQTTVLLTSVLLKNEAQRLESQAALSEKDQQIVALINDLLRNPKTLEGRIEKIVNSQRVTSEYTQEQVRFLKGIREFQKEKRKGKTVNAQEYALLAGLEVPQELKKDFALMLKSIRPDYVGGFGANQRKGLKELAQHLETEKRTLDFKYLEEYVKAHPKNAGAQALLERVKMVGTGMIMEAGAKWYEAAPAIISVGLNGKPSRTALKTLKQEWANDPKVGLAARARTLKTIIDSIEKKIREKQDISSREHSILESAKGELEELYQLVDSDTITRDFLNWFVEKYGSEKARVLGNRLGEEVDTAGSWVWSGIGEYLYFESYQDVTNGEPMNAQKAIDILRGADKKLNGISEQWQRTGMLYSLDPTAEAKTTDRAEMIRIKQALSFLININTNDPDKLAKMNGGETSFSLDNLLHGRELNELKRELLNYYGVLVKGENNNLYFEHVFDQKGLGTFNRYDIKILVRLLQGSNIKEAQELLKKLKALEENEEAFDEDDQLDMDLAKDLLIEARRALFGIGAEDKIPSFTIGNPNAAGISSVDDKSSNPLTYIMPFFNADWREQVVENSPINDDQWYANLLEQAKQLPGEVAFYFIAQQINLRYRMIWNIYVDLPKEVITETSHGNWKSAMRLTHLFLWPRLALLWYRDFFNELSKDEPNYAKALAIFWAVNYLTLSSMGNSIWDSTWGKTLNLDHEVLELAKKVPGLEKGISKFIDWAKQNNVQEAGLIKRWAARNILRTNESGQIRSRLEGKWQALETRHPGFKYVRNGLKLGFNLPGFLFKNDLITDKWDYNLAAEKIRGENSGRARRALAFTMRHAGTAGWELFGMGWDITKRAVKYPFSYAANRFDSALTREFIAKGGSRHVNPTDILAGVEIDYKGNLKANGEGSIEETAKLIDVLLEAKKGNGNLFGTYRDGFGFILNENGQPLKISSIRVIKGNQSYYVSQNHQAILFIGSDYLKKALDVTTLGQSARQSAAELESGKVDQLTNRPLDPKQNQQIVDSVLDRAKAIRRSAAGITVDDAFWAKEGALQRAAVSGNPDLLRAHLVAAHKSLTRQTMRHVQLQSQLLFSDGVNEAGKSYKNILLQIGTGEGKSWTDLYTSLQEALKNRGEKVYLITTDDALVEQLESDYKEIQKIFDSLGVKVGFRYENAKGDPLNIYNNSNIVVVNIARHAFDLIEYSKAIKGGVMVADEVDFYALETAATSYVQSGPKGATGNPILDYRQLHILRNKWTKAWNVLNEIFELENKNKGEYFKNGRFTLKAIEYIKNSMGKNYNAFTSMQFKALQEAVQLIYEKDLFAKGTKADHSRAGLSDKIKFKVEYIDIKTKKIIDEETATTERYEDIKSRRLKPYRIIPQEESGAASPNKRFGRGVDEALRTILGLKIDAQHITMADTDIRRVFRHHSKILGLSGSIGASHEMIAKVYPDLDFKVVEMPSFIPRVEIELSDINDSQKLADKIAALKEQIKQSVELGDRDFKLSDIYAKLLIKGANAEQIAQVESAWQEAIEQDPAMEGKKLSILEWQKHYIHNKEARIAEAAREAIAKSKNQPVLICLEEAKDFRLFWQELKKLGHTEINPLTDSEDFAKAKKKASQKGVISLTYFSRGLDMEMKVAEIIDNISEIEAQESAFIKGGLHVISLGAKTRAKIIQQLGRGGRSAFPGSGSEYLGTGDVIFDHISSESREALKAFEEGKYNLYDPASKSISEAVEEGFRDFYQRNYEATLKNFEQSEVKEKLLNTMTELAESATNREMLAKAVIANQLDYLFIELGIKDGEVLTKKQINILEQRLTKLTGKRTVKLGLANVPINRATLRGVITDKLTSVFSKLRQGDVNVDQKILLGCEAGSCTKHELFNLKMKEMIGEAYGETLSGLEDISHEIFEGQSKEVVQQEMERYTQRRTAALLGKIMKEMFPRTSLYNLARPGTHTFRAIEIKQTDYQAMIDSGKPMGKVLPFPPQDSIEAAVIQQIESRKASASQAEPILLTPEMLKNKPFDIKAKLIELLGGEKNVRLNGAFENVPVELQKAFVDAIETAGLKSVIIRDGVRFEQYLDFITALKESSHLVGQQIKREGKLAKEGLVIDCNSETGLPIAGRYDLKAGQRGFVSPSGVASKARINLPDFDPHVIDPAKVDSLEALVRQIEQAPENSRISYQSAEKIKVRGRSADFKAWLEKGDAKAFERIAEATIKANSKMSPDYIKTFLKGSALELYLKTQSNSSRYLKAEISLISVNGTKAQLMEQLTTIPLEVTGENGQKARFGVKIQDAEALLSADAEVRKQAELRIIQDAKAKGMGATSQQIYETVEAHVKAQQTSLKYSFFAEQELMKLQAELFQNEQAKFGRELKKASPERQAEIIAQIETQVAQGVEAHRVDFEAKVNEYFKSSNEKSIADGVLEQLWQETKGERLLAEGKYKEYFAKGAPGAKGIVAKTGAIGYRTAKDGLLGLGVGVVTEGGTELINLIRGKDASLSRFALNSAKSGLHWMRFGAMCAATQHLMGWSEAAGMYTAMALPALWDLNSAAPGTKGRVFVAHGGSMGSFLLSMKLAPKIPGISKLFTRFPKAGGWIGLAIGMTAAWGFGKLNDALYTRSESWRDFVNSEPMETTGAVLGATSTSLTTAWGLSLGAGALKATAGTLALLDSLALAFGGEATFGGATTVLTSSAAILSKASVALLAVASAKGVLAAHYKLANGDYEESIAQRFGQSLTEYYRYTSSKDNALLRLGWWAAEGVAGGFKHDQFVEDGAKNFKDIPGELVEFNGDLYTTGQKNYLEGVIEYIGGDFSDSLKLKRNIGQSLIYDALQHIFSNNLLSGDAAADYNTALGFVAEQIEKLGEDVILDEKEQNIYQAVLTFMAYNREIKSFDDPKLIKFVAKLTSDKAYEAAKAYMEKCKEKIKEEKAKERFGFNNPEVVKYIEKLSPSEETKAKELINKIKTCMLQNQIKQVLLINPREMGSELYDMIEFWVVKAPQYEKNNPKMMAGSRRNPFSGTPIMQLQQVQASRDQFARFFDDKGRLKPGQAHAFAKLIVDGNLGGKGFRKHLQGQQEQICANIFMEAAEKVTPAQLLFQKAEADSRKWASRYIYQRKAILALMTNGKATAAQLEKANRRLAYVTQKWQESLAAYSKAKLELNSFKIQILVLQQAWHEEKNEFKKSLIAAQIKGLGGSVEGIDQKYIDKAKELIEQLKNTDPKKRPRAYTRIINGIMKQVKVA